eukprot:177167_1
MSMMSTSSEPSLGMLAMTEGADLMAKSTDILDPIEQDRILSAHKLIADAHANIRAHQQGLPIKTSERVAASYPRLMHPVSDAFAARISTGATGEMTGARVQRLSHLLSALDSVALQKDPESGEMHYRVRTPYPKGFRPNISVLCWTNRPGACRSPSAFQGTPIVNGRHNIHRASRST